MKHKDQLNIKRNYLNNTLNEVLRCALSGGDTRKIKYELSSFGLKEICSLAHRAHTAFSI